MDNQQTSLSTNSVFNLPETYTETNYLEAGKRLAKAGQFLNWQIGRWYNSLEWGDKRDICVKAGLNYASAKDCGSIEKKIIMSMRNDNLTFQHHKVIAIDALSDDQRTELLQQAENKQMSSKQLTTARDILLGRDTAINHEDPPTTTDNTAPVQASDNTEDEAASEIPAVNTTIPEQSYNATFEANRALADLKQDNVNLVVKYDAEHLRAVRLEGDIRGLKSEITKLEEAAINDENIITKLNDQIAKLQNQALSNTLPSADLSPRAYSGNSKEFKAMLVPILGADNNVISAERKKAYAALNIVPKANGQLKSDADRLAVYEWLVINA